MSVRAATLWVALSLAITGCKAKAAAPEADLAESLAAQNAISKVRQRWESSDYAGLIAIEPALTKHLDTFKADPSARAAMGMLAIVALEKGDTDRADSLARLLDGGPAGSSHDSGVVVLGAIARRAGRFERALAVLTPLFNKLIDPPTRFLLNRELVLAAIGAKDWDAAARYLRAFLTQSSPALRLTAEHDAGELTRSIDDGALLALLTEESKLDEADRWLLDLLAKHLAQVALTKQDPKLARALLLVAAPLLRDQADAVARIAARGAGVRLERNTVGLVMPLRSDEHRRRGLEVAAGLAFALDIPGSKTKLLVRDDQGDLATEDETLALLNADGAAVIIAGFDTEESDLALAYAERTNVPLVLLRPPSRRVQAEGPVFVLGEAPAEVEAKLVAALVAAGNKRVAVLSGERPHGDQKLDPAVVAIKPCGASVDFVHTSAADAVVLDGGPACSEAALESLEASFDLAFGLDARAGSRPRTWLATAGLFPLAAGAASDRGLVAFRKLDRGDPSWWTGLGYDAGLLVKDAIVGLPTEEDAAALAGAMRKRIVADAIAKAEASLWTSDAKGFEGARVLKRTIGARAASSAPPAKLKPKR